MIYSVVVANGEMVTERQIGSVSNIVIENDVYILYDKEGTILFSSPIDSTVSIELA